VIVIGVMGGLNIRAVSNREGRLSTESTWWSMLPGWVHTVPAKPQWCQGITSSIRAPEKQALKADLVEWQVETTSQTAKPHCDFLCAKLIPCGHIYSYKDSIELLVPYKPGNFYQHKFTRTFVKYMYQQWLVVIQFVALPKAYISRWYWWEHWLKS